eukprot:2475501-Pleurochrysis_carterae.AAC.2
MLCAQLRAAQPRIPARRSSASPRTTLHLSTTCRPYAKPLRVNCLMPQCCPRMACGLVPLLLP